MWAAMPSLDGVCNNLQWPKITFLGVFQFISAIPSYLFKWCMYCNPCGFDVNCFFFFSFFFSLSFLICMFSLKKLYGSLQFAFPSVHVFLILIFYFNLKIIFNFIFFLTFSSFKLSQ
jgi:hypothetical protein